MIIEITHKGSEKAKPAIWYAGKEGRQFEVELSKEYNGVYQVAEGSFKGFFILKTDCKLIPTAPNK